MKNVIVIFQLLCCICCDVPQSGLVCTCMARILDANVMGDLQCEPNATAGKLTVTTNGVTTNRDFSIRIVATNSRESAEIIDNVISKRVFHVSFSTYYTFDHKISCL